MNNSRPKSRPSASDRIVGCVWNFLMWVPTFLASRMALFIIGLVNFAITIVILRSVMFLSAYLPLSSSGCQYPEKWQNTSGSPIFFHVACNLSASVVVKPICAKPRNKRCKMSEIVSILPVARPRAAHTHLPAWPGRSRHVDEPQNQANPCYLSDCNLG